MDFSVPKQIPMARAVGANSPSGLTAFIMPTASAICTASTRSPPRHTIFPKSRFAMSSTTATPKRVARIRSNGVGEPPPPDQPIETVRNADHFPVIFQDGSFHRCPNDRAESGRIAAAGTEHRISCIVVESAGSKVVAGSREIFAPTDLTLALILPWH